MSRLKAQKADVCSGHCPSREILNDVTSTWGTLILMVLLEKTYRFSELRKKIEGISEKMLAQTLQTLEKDGFVERKVYPVIPPKVEYSLTPLGKGVAAEMESLIGWIEKNMPAIMKNREKNA